MKHSISVTLSELKAAHKLLGKMNKPRKLDMGLTDYECSEELEFYYKLDNLLIKAKRR